MKFNKKDLFIAGVRYFDLENNGIEYGNNLAYVIVNREISEDGILYRNVFDMSESYPTFSRSRFYGNCTSDGLEYGSKMVVEGGKLESGPCWVIEEALSEYPIDDIVSDTVLENIILSSDKYYKDRSRIALKKIKRNPFKMIKIITNDMPKQDYMNDYFQKRMEEKVKKI